MIWTEVPFECKEVTFPGNRIAFQSTEDNGLFDKAKRAVPVF